ncbi:hypothetical protein MUA02_01285 [Enterobacteriaceae bacterium H20N1]|uniref:Uncharacterized protein n=1 Tax=Dryocola boscaweniae TaxID=2925397 RepID=A0A9X2W412_9ENTR|nr:hypothetical protein [Dryocola boscaweniae]MCT4700541.1 hypothetical protein [Dryocola boscaweniae]MCT4717697.1 hypothetical protein [Dryocola boscaweniae]
MVYAFFFFLALIPASYNALLTDLSNVSSSSINSAVNYIDNVRGALERYRAENADKEGTVAFSKLLLPDSAHLVERSDSHFLIDSNGIYIVFDKPFPGLADALMKKYSDDTGPFPEGERKGLIGYYHTGFNRNGCLMTVARYPEESSGCTRPLPPTIAEGALVFTDRGHE